MGARVCMYQLGALDGDPLFDLFVEAERVLPRLSEELHNRSTPSGGRRPWEPGPMGDGSG